jgi:hypothetical protein
MRSAIRATVICAALGCVLNVLVAWACAMWSQPHGVAVSGFGVGWACDPLLMGILRREFFERTGPDPGGSDPGTLFVAGAYKGFGAQFLDVAVEDRDIPIDAFKGPLPYIGVVRTGWPWLTLEAQCEHDASRSPTPLPSRWKWAIPIPKRFVSANRLFLQRMLPFRPMWPGFALNTLLCAALLSLPFVVRLIIRKLRGRCMTCGYPIGISPVCTECGRPVKPRMRGANSPAKLSA